MRPYETLVVLAGSTASDQKALLDRFQSVITAGGGTFETNHDWGNRKLSYPIKKEAEGHYYLFEYSAEPAVVSELERQLRISDGVLRYMSVQQPHTGLPKPRPRESSRDDVPLSEMRSGGPRYDAPPRRDAPPADPRPAAAAPAADPPSSPPATDSPAASAPAGSEGVKTDE